PSRLATRTHSRLLPCSGKLSGPLAAALLAPSRNARAKLSAQERERRGVQLRGGRSHDIAAGERPTPLPVRHDTTGALEDGNERHGVEGLELPFHDEIDVAGGEHRVVVAITAEAMQHAGAREPLEGHGRL